MRIPHDPVGQMAAENDSRYPLLKGRGDKKGDHTTGTGSERGRMFREEEADSVFYEKTHTIQLHYCFAIVG